MPFPPQIHKEILLALERSIIPALQDYSVTQVLAEPPFDFSGVEYKIVQKKWLEYKKFAPLQTIAHWRKQCVMATQFPRIMVVFRGTCITRVGITKNTAQQIDAPQEENLGGINELMLHAPAVICHPPFMVHSSGVPRPDFVELNQGLFYCSITKSDVRISLNIRTSKSFLATHHLEIDDGELIRTAHLYIESLRMGSLQSAQSLLLGFMRRLRDNLLRHRAALSNSCWIIPPDILPEAPKVLSSSNLQLCQSVTEYIISHLHADLSLENLAKRFGVSSVHLNAVFRRARGITVMRFVTQMRLEAAKNILTTTPERVNDVAQLVGFASNASFCTVFQRRIGQSPGQYRKMMNEKYF